VNIFFTEDFNQGYLSCFAHVSSFMRPLPDNRKSVFAWVRRSGVPPFSSEPGGIKIETFLGRFYGSTTPFTGSLIDAFSR
jgi:hypothetical protein